MDGSSSFNKGEWSELYVFLKLLGEGVLHPANSDMEMLEDIYYPIVSIVSHIGNNISNVYETCSDGKITIKDGHYKTISRVDAHKFLHFAGSLLKRIQNSAGRSFSVDEEIERFINEIRYTKIKSPSKDKRDITVVLHDVKTLKNVEMGFSIKSMLGSPSTLLNPESSTNFIYLVTGKQMSDQEIAEVNGINTKSKIKDRINSIVKRGGKLEFVDIDSANFYSNLQMIDSRFPDIVSEYLLQEYLGNDRTVKALTRTIEKLNPCGVKNPGSFYEYKIKDLLTAAALGMTPSKPWNGVYDATGGYIVVNEDGDLFCFHVFNRNEFREYLFKTTKLDGPSSSRFQYGSLFKYGTGTYFKLNLQIRFIK